MLTHLPIFTFLTSKQLIWWIHKIKRVSGKTWDDVAQLEAKHHQPALHICESNVQM